MFVFILFCFAKANAQCGTLETISICDMTVIDGNMDGNPDGIINLYDEYNALPGVTPISLASGTWFDPDFNFALDETTGDLYLWDLDNASENIDDYQFQLLDPSSGCANDIVVSLNVILGPFSGLAVPTTGSNDINIEICDVGIDPCGSFATVDLYTALLSIPSPHLNGIWEYEGSSTSFISIEDNRFFFADVPYQPGVPLVDEETFELVYRVPGINPCAPEAETRIKISVVRQVFSGFGNTVNICESELIAGDFDDVDLRDDLFLINEDIEGIWLDEEDPTGQISNPGDSQINLGAVYDELYATNPRFGCAVYDYTYFVESRSTICPGSTTTVSFTFFESIRPFQQDVAIPEFCVGDETLDTIDLYDYLTFTTENGTLYDYPDPSCTNWSLVSGPSSLGLVENTGDLCSITEDPEYTTSGTIDLTDLSNLDAGTYVFQYTVLPEYTCDANLTSPEIIYQPPSGCLSTQDPTAPCQGETAQVTIIIHPYNYAGEDTDELAFCETDISSPIDLIALLNTNGIDDPIYVGPLGTWTDLTTGNTINNPFTIPDINGQQTFSFNYSTTTDNDCDDSADLTFTIYEKYSAGSGITIEACNIDDPINLFELLNGDPDTNGTWTGPGGFSSPNSTAIIDPISATSGDYIYSVPANGLCDGDQAVITLTIFDAPVAGPDTQGTVCVSDESINLSDYLGSSAEAGGTFLDSNGTGALSGSILDVSTLSGGVYMFEYQLQGHPSCGISSAFITITVIEVAPPDVSDQTFCLLDAATISDLEVGNASTVYWYDTAESSTALPFDTLLEDGEDYFAVAVDSNGCESERVGITVALLPLNDPECDPCINDGVSPNGDGLNDALDLCTFPILFPNYEINIYNRYGTLVFTGNINTPPFIGLSNVPLTIGDELPAGVYFYIFDPRDGITDPFQDNFYLSR